MEVLTEGGVREADGELTTTIQAMLQIILRQQRTHKRIEATVSKASTKIIGSLARTRIPLQAEAAIAVRPIRA
jgi:hypothetical protein